MKILSNKCQLSERDLEDWLYENPNECKFPYSNHCVDRWIARQLHVPSGIIDLLGVNEEFGCAVLVELKNTPDVRAEYLTQINRYFYDIQCAMEKSVDYDDFAVPQILKFLIGPFEKISGNIQFEANAMDISIMSIHIELSANISGPWSFTPEHRSEITKKSAALQNSKEIKSLIRARAVANALRSAENSAGNESEADKCQGE